MSFSRTHARAAIVAAASAALVALLAIGAHSQQTKPDEGGAAREGGSPPLTDTRTVPSSSEPPGGSQCAPGWRSFDNPVMHYALCIPPAWGFSRFTDAAPLTQILVRSLENLRLLSANAFPWAPGTRPFDAIATKDIVDVELDLLQQGAQADDCTPMLDAGAKVASCVQSYDALGLPALDGPVRALKVVVPSLRRVQDDDGASLQVIVRAGAARFQRDGDLIWQLIDAIHAY